MGKILIAQLNEKQSDYEVLRDAVNLLADQIQKEEKEIDEFKVERINKSAKVIILMGRTGGGKSTFSNRLSGDTSVLGDQGPSIASASCKSVTQENSKQLITFGDHLIAVVDTPGVGDSYGRDREHSNRLCAYLKGCGGINAFVVVCNGACPRFDAHFKQMLQQYDLMFGGKAFWERLIIVATRVESYVQKQFRKENLLGEIGVLFNIEDVKSKIQVIPIGFDGYEQSLKDFVAAIPADRLEFKQVESPIDELRVEHEAEQGKLDALSKTIRGIQTQIYAVDSKLALCRNNQRQKP